MTATTPSPSQPAPFTLLTVPNPTSNSKFAKQQSRDGESKKSQVKQSKTLTTPSGDAFSTLLSDSFGNGIASPEKDEPQNLFTSVAMNVQLLAWIGWGCLAAMPSFTSPTKPASQQKYTNSGSLSTSSNPAPPHPRPGRRQRSHMKMKIGNHQTSRPIQPLLHRDREDGSLANGSDDEDESFGSLPNSAAPIGSFVYPQLLAAHRHFCRS